MQTRTLQIIGWIAIALTAALMLWGILKPWGLGLDFANFYDAGQKARAGQFGDLYDSTAEIAGRPPLGNMTFYSAPLTSYLYAPMAALSPQSATLAFKLAGSAALAAALVMLYRHCRTLVGPTRRERTEYFALFACAALLFQPFWTIYRVGGQTTPFVFLLFVAGLIAFTRSNLAAAALTYAAAVLIKPVFVPGAMLTFVLSGNAFRRTALVCGLSVAALSWWLFGLDLHLEFIHRTLAKSAAMLAPWLNSSPFSFLQPWLMEALPYGRLKDMPVLPARVGTVLQCLSAAALLLVLLRHLRLPLVMPARRHAVLTTGLAISLFLSPVVWGHYLAVLFPALAAFGALRGHLPRTAQAVLALATLLSVFQSNIFINQLEKLGVRESFPAAAAAAFLESLPALLILGVLIVWQRAIGEVLLDPAWSRFGGAGHA